MNCAIARKSFRNHHHLNIGEKYFGQVAGVDETEQVPFSKVLRSALANLRQQLKEERAANTKLIVTTGEETAKAVNSHIDEKFTILVGSGDSEPTERINARNVQPATPFL